ncbi:MAG: SDR family oxidoreductase [Acidobacteriota bacterium]|nr:SDR family oxidoreductase [Acidobacteriota bacterium]
MTTEEKSHLDNSARPFPGSDGRAPALERKLVLVTGASRGIGLAIAQACAREGAELLLVSRRAATLKLAVREVPGAAGFIADVTKEAEVAKLFSILRRRVKRLDVVVNNAGVFTYKPFTQTSLADWEINLRTNLTSLYLVTRAALPLLQRAHAPHMVNILSVSSRKAFPKCSAYCASKFGALGFTRVIAEEFRAFGIRVTAVLPGSTSTRMTNEFDFPVVRENLLQPSDVARAVVAALAQPPRAGVDEILLTPSQGNLAARRKR